MIALTFENKKTSSSKNDDGSRNVISCITMNKQLKPVGTSSPQICWYKLIYKMVSMSEPNIMHSSSITHNSCLG